MTKAFDLGSQYSWWPDWWGGCVAIVASGPSMKGFDASILKDRINVIAIKTSVDICPWADIVYGCDAPWWVDRKGLPNFKGLKLYHGVGVNHYDWKKDMHKVEIDLRVDDILVDEPLKIGNGGNSCFQATNLAIQFGATDIILIGFDCHDRGGLHWYGRNTWLNANNPMQINFDRWKKGFEKAQPTLKKLGTTIINASMESDLQCFPKKPLQEAMRDWGL